MKNMDLQDYTAKLLKCWVFKGIEEKDMLELLSFVSTRVEHFHKGEIIHHYGDGVQEMGLILEGQVIVEYCDIDGSKANLSMLKQGEEFGAFIAIGGESFGRIMVYAGLPTTVFFIDIRALNSLSVHSKAEAFMMNNLLTLWSEKLMYLYHRLIIFSHRLVKDRIRLSLSGLKCDGDVIEVPLNRTEWADFLGVDRTALSRELGKLQAEGIIEVRRNRIRLLDESFLQAGR